MSILRPPVFTLGVPPARRASTSMLLTRRVLVATLASAPAARRSTEHTCKVIDSAVHVWSNGQPPYPWAVAPPEELTSAATYEALAASAKASGVAGALIVQPANHQYDHSYVTAALRAHPELYRGMCLANPTLAPAAAAAELERLHADGFVGVRFNPYLFPDGLDSPVGHALYKKAGCAPGLGGVGAAWEVLCLTRLDYYGRRASSRCPWE